MATRHIISLDLDNSTNTCKLISAVLNLEEQTLAIKQARVCKDEETIAAIVAETNPFVITLIAGYNNDSAVHEIEEPISARNLDHYREASMVSNENTVVDWFNVGSHGLLISINSDEPANLRSALAPNLKLDNINHSSIVLIYAFNRIYPDYFEKTVTGLLHIADSMAILIAIEHGKLISHRVAYDLLPFEASTKHQHLIKLQELINTSMEDLVKANCPAFDKILFSGDISDEVVPLFAHAKFGAELWDLRRNTSAASPLNFSSCNILDSYAWVVPICGALMAAEGLGVDLLSLQDNNICRDLTQELSFQIHESVRDKLKESGLKIWANVWPAVVAQSRLLAACLLIGLGLFAYRFWVSETSANQLQAQLESEGKRSEALANVKKEYTEYRATVKTISDRIITISNIRDNQLVVPTTIHELLRSSPNFISYTTIDVTGTNIRATGRSNDKKSVVDFFNNLALQGQFQNVTPIYDSTDPLKCEFTFETQYRGNIGSLNFIAPLTQQLAKIETK